MSGYANFHGWRYSQGLTNLCKVLVHNVDRHGMRLILQLLAEGISSPTHAP
jgi:hypothetical protein